MENSNFRPLGAIEKLFWLLDQSSQVHFVIAAELSRLVNPIKLRKALADIQLKHPLLASRIIDNGFEHPYFEHIPSASIPLTLVEKSEKHTLSIEMANELGKPFFFNEAPLIRCTLITDATHSILLFAVHHTVSDGISMTIVFRDILEALAGKTLTPVKLPPSVDQLLNQGNPSVLEMQEIVHSDKNPIHRRKETIPKVTLKSLSLNQSEKIVARSKVEHTSVQGILYAAAISAARKAQLPWSLSTIKVIVPISIRKAITNDTSSALYINSKAIFSAYSGAMDFWELARYAKKELSGVKEMELINTNLIETRKRLFSQANIEDLSDSLQKGVVREMMISNLGKVVYYEDLKEIKINHIWGPLALSGTKDEITIGVTTVNNIICVSSVTRTPDLSFTDLIVAELLEACNL